MLDLDKVAKQFQCKGQREDRASQLAYSFLDRLGHNWRMSQELRSNVCAYCGINRGVLFEKLRNAFENELRAEEDSPTSG